MKTQIIRVQLNDMNTLAEILCEIDFEQAENNSREVVKLLVEIAHETISKMLGEHESEIYQKD